MLPVLQPKALWSQHRHEAQQPTHSNPTIPAPPSSAAPSCPREWQAGPKTSLRRAQLANEEGNITGFAAGCEKQHRLLKVTSRSTSSCCSPSLGFFCWYLPPASPHHFWEVQSSWWLLSIPEQLLDRALDAVSEAHHKTGLLQGCLFAGCFPRRHAQLLPK